MSKQKRHFILLTIKQFLPWAIILAVALAIITTFTARDLNYIVYQNSGGYYVFFGGGIRTDGALNYYMPFIGTAFGLLLPMVAFSYRIDRKSSDYYQQLPFSRRFNKNLRLLIGYLCVLLPYVLAALYFGFYAYVKYATYVLPEPYASDPNYSIMVVYPQWYFLTALNGILPLTVAYGISAFFQSQNSNRNGCAIAMGQSILVLYVFVPSIYAMLNAFDPAGNIFSKNGFNPEFETMELFLANKIFYPLITKNELEPAGRDLPARLIEIGFAIACSIGGWVYSFLCDEPSGETAGKPGARDKIAFIIFVATLAMLIPGFSTSGIWTLFGLPFQFFQLYLLCAFYNRSFRISKKYWITIGAIVGAILLLSIASGIVQAQYYLQLETN